MRPPVIESAPVSIRVTFQSTSLRERYSHRAGGRSTDMSHECISWLAKYSLMT